MDHIELVEVDTMFKQIMQAVKDGHSSLQDQQERLIRLLEGLLEDPKSDGLPDCQLSSEQLLIAPLPELSMNSGDKNLIYSSWLCDADGEDHNSTMARRHSAHHEIIKDEARRRSGNYSASYSHLFLPYVFLHRLKKFVKDPRFDFAMGTVILLNSFYIGFEIEDSIHNESESTEAAEYIFLGIYMVELLLRTWAFGVRPAFENRWNCLDLLLVSLGSLSLFVIEPIKRHTDSKDGADFLQQITIFRLLRLLRLVRSLRLLQQFRILWGLVNGLLHALPAILSTLALLFLLIFIFACGGVELITKSKTLQAAALEDPEIRSIVDLHFSTLPKVSLTLIRFTTMDSIGGIYEPLVREEPVLILYFVFALLVISITLMNLITAVLVEHSLTMAKMDKDLEEHTCRKKVKAMIPQIEDLFVQLDSNADGLLTFQEARSSDALMPEALSHLVGVDTLVDLFEALDNDSSGSVDREEFVEGLIDLALSEVPLETIKILHCCRVQKKQATKILKQLHILGVEVESCKAAMRNPFRTLSHGYVGQALGKRERDDGSRSTGLFLEVPSSNGHGSHNLGSTTTPSSTDVKRGQSCII